MADVCDLKQVDAVSVDGTRTRLDIIRKLGGGGEGVVCEGADSTGQPFAVKLFKDDRFNGKLPKIRAMLNADPEKDASERHIAWPLALAESRGVPVGYIMTKVNGLQLVHATEPQHRWNLQHHLDFFSLHWLAENLASAVEKLHALGHVCGDFKDQNVLFDEKTLVVFLIDTDSFGVSSATRFRPDAYTQDWSPPEFLKNTSRSCDDIGAEHDLFSLAVLFHHLFFSVHPFSGEVQTSVDADLSIVDAIKEGCWLYRNSPTPNDHSTPLTVVAPALRQLFQRAFVDGHVDPRVRPSAKTWRETFREARWGLRWCDQHPLHVHDGSTKTCPWCARKTDIWGHADKARAQSKDVAIEELHRLDFAGEARFQAIEYAKRRLDANPGFASRVQSIVDRIERIESALSALSKAGNDDLALIEAARVIQADPDLTHFAQRRGLAGLLDAAEQRNAELRRLDELIAAAEPENGRYLLASEQGLVTAFEREVQRIQLGDAILSRYRPRIEAAMTRIRAMDDLEQALARPAKGNGLPLAQLASALADADGHLGTLRDPAVAQRIAIAQSVISLSKHLDASADDYPDRAIVHFWNRYLAPTPTLGILDAKSGPEQLSLRQKIQRSLDSVAAIERLEAQLRRPLSDFADHAAYDHAVVAADPAGRISERGREAFDRSPVKAQLVAARSRLEVNDRLNRLATSANRDRDDPELVGLWRQTSDRDKLVLSKRAHERLVAAVERLARFEGIRGIAEADPADDEALLAALSDHTDDLHGLALTSGETLGARIELARHRIGVRNSLVHLIAEVDSAPENIKAERKIQGAWSAAQPARQQAPVLFYQLFNRAELARRRIETFDALRVALRERHGECARELWLRFPDGAQRFAPMSVLEDEISSLLERYDEFRDLLARAESGLDRAELLQRATVSPDLLNLKDADVKRHSLGGLSLRQYLNRLEYERHNDWFGDLALDPARLRGEIAEFFESLRDSIDTSDLGTSVVNDEWRAAFRADRIAEKLRAILTLSNPDSELVRFRRFLRYWDEAWHPLLPSTASLVQPARDLAIRVMTNAVPDNVTLETLDSGRSIIQWKWPFAIPSEEGAANGSCQMMVITLGPREASDPISGTTAAARVFRQCGEERGEVEIANDFDHKDISLVAGCVIGGEPIYSSARTDIPRKPQVLDYRFQRAGWRRRPDALFLSSERPMLSPELKVVHTRTGMTLTLLPSYCVGPGEVLIDLSPEIAQQPGLKRSRLRRLRDSTSFSYRIEIRNPTDRTRVQLNHPQSSKDRELSVGWF